MGLFNRNKKKPEIREDTTLDESVVSDPLKKSMRGIAKDMIEAFKKAFGLGKDGKKAEGSKTTAEAKGTGTAASGKTSAKKKKTTAKNKKEEKEWQAYRETKEYEKARKKIEQGTQEITTKNKYQ